MLYAIYWPTTRTHSQRWAIVVAQRNSSRYSTISRSAACQLKAQKVARLIGPCLALFMPCTDLIVVIAAALLLIVVLAAAVVSLVVVVVVVKVTLRAVAVPPAPCWPIVWLNY